MNIYLLIGGSLSLVASALHIGVIVGGPDWLRFFGAGERMAVMAENGSWYPGLVTGFIAVALMVMGAYALAASTGGAGSAHALPLPLPLPFVKWIVLAITAVYLLRGLALAPMYFVMPEQVNAFAVWSSLIVLALGIFHAVGLSQVWKHL
ncbi:MAG: hypothetical protein JKY25_05330 [Robiginitomaculum sp.]|nr:hypothetical protein [Robiginitomaculum sp.]